MVSFNVIKRSLFSAMCFYHRGSDIYFWINCLKWVECWAPIICQDDACLLGLVRYIHLNPFHAKLVSGHDKLQSYWYGGKKRQIVLARSLLCYWATSELGISRAWLARRLGLSQPAVGLAVARGRKAAEEKIVNGAAP
jgi:hypothetical protein